MRPLLLVVTSLLLAACAGVGARAPLVQPVQGAGDALLIRDVRVFTATDRGVIQADVLVKGDRVEALAPPNTLKATGAFVIEGAGRTLTPGLVDAHVHLSLEPAVPWDEPPPDPARALERFLYAGVTTVYDLGGPTELLGLLRDRTASGELLGPRVRFASAQMSGPGSHPVPFLQAAKGPALACLTDLYLPQPVTPEEARRAVARGPDGDLYKIIFDSIPRRSGKLDRAPLAAAVETAHDRGWTVFAHVGDADDAVFAVEIGVDVLAHLSYRGEVTRARASRVAATGAKVIPTQVVWETVRDLANGRYAPSALDQAVAPELMASLTDGRGRSYENTVLDDIRVTLNLFQPSWTPSLRHLHQAGVPLVAGTDAGLPGVIPGAALHKELAFLEAAGLSREEVLLSATRRGAELLGPARFGHVSVGAAADLLLVEGDPLEDLSSLGRIVYIIRGGRLLERAPRQKSEE